MQFTAIKEDGKLSIDTPKLWKDELNKYRDGTKFTVILERSVSRRTTGKGSQNNALHKYFELLAGALNDAGYSIQHVLKYFTIDLDWDTNSVKSIVWKPMQKALLGTDSTTELKKLGEIDYVYDTLNRSLGQKLGIYVEFPHDPEKQKEKQYLTTNPTVAYPRGFEKPLL